MTPKLMPLGLIALALAACGDTGASGAFKSPKGTSQVTSNTLPQTGQGNSGGVLATSSGAPAAGVEATMSYNAGGRAYGARVDFHNGPMAGVGARCSRAGGGAGAPPECSAINASKVWLVNELSGEYAYAGAFAVEGFGPDSNQNGLATVHSGPGMGQSRFVELPAGSASYDGRFQAGGALTHNGQTFEGRISGNMDLAADFASGTMSGSFNGAIIDGRSGLQAPLSAGFSNAQIGLGGRFYNTGDTTFMYGGQQAWGELDGAFYGPGAEEAAGTFGFGNARGGMTGVMLGCDTSGATNCLLPDPRF